MSLIVLAIVGGGALAAGVVTRWALGRRRPALPPRPPVPAVALPGPSPSPLARSGFSFELGDVIEIGGRELWLEQGWLLSEGTDAVAALFRAGPTAVLTLAPPSTATYLLDAAELALPGEPPSVIEVGAVRFERVRRLPVELAALGKTPPLPWSETLLTEYRGLGDDALWVLGTGAGARAWQGRVVREPEIERWGGGDATLE